MTVFKTYLHVLNKAKGVVILFSVLLIVFAATNMKTSDNNMTFVASKPDVYIVNGDESNSLTDGLIKYISDNCKIIKLKDDEEAISDALFYRDVNMIIRIEKGFGKALADGRRPAVKIESTGDYQSALAKLYLERYLKTAYTYADSGKAFSAEEMASHIEKALSTQVDTVVTTKLDTDKLNNISFYYNFLSYSIMAGTIYAICIILYSFRQEKIRKRIIISSMDYRKHNAILLLANCLLAIFIWCVYVAVSRILCGDIIFSAHGAIHIVNSFIFTVCAVTMAFLISSIVNTKNAISGIVNVVALGSSFLCGAFVPSEYLPDAVLTIAHILPTYWYIKTNDAVKTLEEINADTLRPLVVNMAVVAGFAVLFVVITNIVTKKKQKIR